jgi:hypothetical protein
MAENQKPKETPEVAARLVMPDGERKPVASTMTRDELLDAIKLIVGSQRTAEEIATSVAREVASDVAASVFDRMEGKTRHGDWNIANFPERSVFNPQGDHPSLGLPRPELDGEVFWVGTPMDEREMSREEIEAANAIRPGVYHNGQWKVINLAPGMNKRALLVVFPCVEPDQRSSLPSMLAMLREMTGERVAAVA